MEPTWTEPRVFTSLRDNRAIRQCKGVRYSYPVLRGIYHGVPVEGSITHDGRALLYTPDVAALSWTSDAVAKHLLHDLRLALAALPKDVRRPQRIEG